MPAPKNAFKAALKGDAVLYGCWLTMADMGAAELMGTIGYDWLLIDCEHSPNDIRSTRDALIALEPSPSPALVRVPIGEAWVIKQAMDAGAQTVLVPMVESGAQAEELVRTMRYPPDGFRGVGAAGARVSRFSQIGDYSETANDEACLLVQVESRAGLAALDDILGVEGLDGVFIGPYDLSADMGHMGNPGHAEVQGAILDALARIRAAGKGAGVMCLGEGTEAYLAAGANFVATAIDSLLLVQAAKARLKAMKG